MVWPAAYWPAHGIPFRRGRFNAQARFIVHSARTSTGPRPQAWLSCDPAARLYGCMAAWWPSSPACPKHTAPLTREGRGPGRPVLPAHGTRQASRPAACAGMNESITRLQEIPHADIPQRHVLRPSAAAGHAVQRRAVGALFLLRDAEHPAHLPVLLADQRGAGHRPGAGRGHRRRLWGQRLSGHHSGRLAGRPGVGAGAHALLFRRGGHAGPRGAGAGAGGGGADRRAGIHCAGQRGG